jgi:DnaJ-class molecular chaperone
MPHALETCWNCRGYGLVADYGSFGMDFYGDKECDVCEGTGNVFARDRKGRFVKHEAHTCIDITGPGLGVLIWPLEDSDLG